jgi:S1-C subfamily serine protease
VDTTGVIIYNNTKDLLILVSLDRVKDAKSIKVVLSDTVSVDAKLQDTESEINLAVIAVPIEDIPEVLMSSLQTAKLGESYTVSVGDPIMALGSPNGNSNSMEIGIVTSKGSYASIMDNRLDLFNTNIEDNKNSDGIIVDMSGDIIGLITRTLKDGNNENLNTVIGISKLKPIISAMGNKDPHIYFGVMTDDMASATKQKYDVVNGIYVDDVQADSPAFDAGIQNGDIIQQINDLAILNSSNFYDTISKYKPGDKVTVLIKRSNGSEVKVNKLYVVLSEKTK